MGQDDQNHSARLGVLYSFGTKWQSAPVLVPGSIGSVNLPTSRTYGSEVAVVVDEDTLLDLAGHENALRCKSCLQICACSWTQTQPFTIPMPNLTKKDWAMNGWLWWVSVSVLGMMCWYVWEISRIRRIPKSVLVEGLLTWEDTRRQML